MITGLVALWCALGAANASPTAWSDVDPLQLVRVNDPNYPGALARSATGAVLAEPPPPGTPWSVEGFPELDLAPGVGADAIAVTNAASWHAAGRRGQGVKVAVFDLAWFGLDRVDVDLGEVSTHDCFAHPSCEVPLDGWRPRAPFEEGVHGIACAEIVRALAPEADLYLVRVNTFSMLENAVDWAIREGIDIISMSMSFYNASFYDGTGPHARLIDKLAAHDVLMVTSAGNNARQHWASGWRDVDGDGVHDGSSALRLRTGAGGGKVVYLAWNQFGACGLTDLDLIVRNEAGNIVGRGQARQRLDADSCSPFERVGFDAGDGGEFTLEIVHVAGATVGLRVSVLSRSGDLNDPVPAGSISDPAAHPRALAVGAVNALDYLVRPAQGYSSQGPTLAGDAKPDIAGPDGTTTLVYGSSGFFGTSASTPAVAALVAVLMSDDPSTGPYEAAERLKLHAFGGPADGRVDPAIGVGRARLPLWREPSSGCEGQGAGCGRQPLLAALFVVPFARRRRRRVVSTR